MKDDTNERVKKQSKVNGDDSSNKELSKEDFDEETRRKIQINGDDSSDEESSKESEFDVGKVLKEFKSQQRDNGKAGYTSYSFIAHAVAIKRFSSASSPAENIYRNKKSDWPKTKFKFSVENVKTWLRSSLKRTLRSLVLIDSENKVSKKIVDDFLENNKDFCDKQIDMWVRETQLFLGQMPHSEPLPSVQKILEEMRQEIKVYLKKLEHSNMEFEAPRSYFQDDVRYGKPIKTYVQEVLVKTGIVDQETERFLNIKDRTPAANVEFSDRFEKAVYKVCAENSQNYSKYRGKGLIPPLFYPLAADRLLSKIYGAYGDDDELLHRKQKRDDEFKYYFLVENNLSQEKFRGRIYSKDLKKKLFNKETYLNYLPCRLYQKFDFERNKILDKLNREFASCFVKNLKVLKKKNGITLERAGHPQQCLIASNSMDELCANVRLNSRVMSRTIRQAVEEQGEEITSKKLQTAWRYGESEYKVLESQKITEKRTRADMVENLGNYEKIYEMLEKHKGKINAVLPVKTRKIDDAIVATWLYETITNHVPVAEFHTRGQKKSILSFNNIPERERKLFKEFLLELVVLLFGVEVQRNPGSLVVHSMMIDLIKASEMTWQDALLNNKMPMSMDGAVPAARGLAKSHGAFFKRPWVYSAGELSGGDVLEKRENALVSKWMDMKGKSEAPIDEKISAIEQAMESWCGVSPPLSAPTPKP